MGGNEMREAIERILSAHEEVDKRFSLFGGIGNLVSMYEQIKYELERVSLQEIDGLCSEVKQAIESLMRIDSECRKVRKLKLVLGTPNGREGEANNPHSCDPPSTEAA